MDQIKNHAKYDQSPEIHGKPRKVSLLAGEAQLAGCLKVWVSGLLEREAFGSEKLNWIGKIGLDWKNSVTISKASFRTLSVAIS